ncbi:MAG TPA: amino acid permease [Cyanobacteria bacterium UBA8530]|nr:amino acid permease [Cyanobacteria bacterium UBA8530]
MKHVLIGQPLPTAGLIHERIAKLQALAVFASDAISSVAYAPEEILLVLALAGSAAFTLSLPIAIAVVALIAIVTYSYRQTIYRYPQGGGTYRVTMDNFGDTAALLAGSSLMLGYILTAAVSTAAGVAAVTSAFPGLFSIRVELALVSLFLLTLVNLRGVKESATIFALPTYVFIFSMLAMIGIGLWRMVMGLPPVEAVASLPSAVIAPTSVFLLLRAFASGCSAMTGTEAMADGVAAFKEPQAKNAVVTLLWMAVILSTLFLGMAILAQHLHILPREGETVLSQLARGVVGRGPFYFLLQGATALILFLAVNTAFADFPRLASFLAADRFLPRQFIFRGDRLAFSTGIIALGVLGGLLLLVVHADVHLLIPLYAVGVFLSFTFSQSGMFKRWWTLREPGWQQGMIINGIGALVTGMVTLLVAITKFTHGAWMILVLLPMFVILFKGIRSHYDRVKAQLFLKEQTLPNFPLPPSKTIILISDVNKATARILRYAMTLSSDVVALHVTDDLDAARKLREKWVKYHIRTHLTILESPYRSLVYPVLAYLDSIESEAQKTPVTIILSAIVPKHWWEYILHNQDGLRIKTALLFRANTVVIDYPYHLD